MSTLTAPKPSKDAPLLPFEQRTLDTLVAQFNATPQRIQAAFLKVVNDQLYDQKISGLMTAEQQHQAAEKRA